jgi:mannose-6-phosphate isomerase-like protein (cupin superfamily)
MVKAARICLSGVGVLAVAALAAGAGDQAGGPKLKPRTVQLNPGATDFTQVLSGPPETVTMESGYVTLRPAASVGRHSTEGYEEILVVLQGSGEMRLAGGAVVKLKPYMVAYCPPRTEHDVVNTGTAPLRYLYIVARAETTK